MKRDNYLRTLTKGLAWMTFLTAFFLISCASKQSEEKIPQSQPSSNEMSASTIPKTPELSTEDQTALMELAHKTLEEHFKGQEVALPADIEEKNLPEYGVFVTLKEKAELRGCIGYITPQGNLFQEVRDCTLLAAFNDPRFPPLEKSELAGISMEISLLSSMEPLNSLDDMELGVDGIMVTLGNARGILLPQVAIEQPMSKEEFVSIASKKAGLGASGWKIPGAQLSRFRVLIISESQEG
jgi:AmmeMemoRadiSam system protein A